MQKLKKPVSILLSLMMIMGIFTILPAATVSASTQNPQLAQETIQGGNILHCFNWSYNNIKAALPDISAAGYTAVQTSPVQRPKDYDSRYNDIGNQWWKLYQPLGFSISNGNNWLGTKAELTSLCAEAETYGIKVVVDIVANHLANGGTDGGTYNYINPNVETDMKNQNYYHTNNTRVKDDNRYTITQYHLGMPDLNTANTHVQQRVLGLLEECVDCGVDGFRFDAAKHIEVPNDPSNCRSQFWPYVIEGIQSYCEDHDYDEPFIYGEILGSAGTDISNYTTYMAVTDNVSGDRALDKAYWEWAPELADGTYSKGASADKSVLWVESHDTYMGDSGSAWFANTSGVSDDVITRAWAIAGSRKDSTGLFFARPNNTMGLASTNTTWKSTEVAEVNKFKNVFEGQSEQLASSSDNKTAYNVRGTKGVVISKLDGGGSVSLDAQGMAAGTYTDHVSGGTFTVANGTITGTVGTKGVAVVYNLNDVSGGDTPTPVADDVLYLVSNSNWKSQNARFAAYFFNNSGNTWASMTAVNDSNEMYQVTIPDGNWTNVIFCRMNPGTTANDWGNRWNQTRDLTIPSNSNRYTIKSGSSIWTEDNDDSSTWGSWDTYVPTCTHTYEQPEWTWSNNYGTAYALFTCTQCGAQTTVQAYVAQHDNGNNTVTYTATASFNDQTYTEQTTQTKPAEFSGKLYLKPGTNWAKDHAQFAIYFFNNSNQSTWASMTDADNNGVYETTVPTGTWHNAIFCRLDKNATSGSWDNRLDQTPDLTPENGKNCYHVADNVVTDDTNTTKDDGVWELYHPCGAPAWSWNAQYTAATATFTCIDCGNQQTVTDNAPNTTLLQDATCTEAGTWQHTATVTFDGKTYTNTTTSPLSPNGHDPVYHERVEPQTTANGNIAYWQCVNCGKFFSDENGEHEITEASTVIPALNTVCAGAIFQVGDPLFIPAGTKLLYFSGTHNEPGVKTYAEDTVKTDGAAFSTSDHWFRLDSMKLRGASTEAGYVCTGYFRFDETTQDNQTCLAVEPIDYRTATAPAWTWDGYGSATAVLNDFYITVGNDRVPITLTQTIETTAITSAITYEGDCQTGSIRTYTATATACDGTFTDTKDQTVAGAHNLFRVDAQEPSCSAVGWHEYWHCGICQKDFTDANGTVEASVNDILIPIDTDAHDYSGAPTAWTWSADHASATATFTCSHNAEHTTAVQTTAITDVRTEPTVSADGSIVYTATVTGPDGESYTGTDTVVLDKTAVAYIAPDNYYDANSMLVAVVRVNTNLQGRVIELLKDATLDYTLTLSQTYPSFPIKLNGHTLTINADPCYPVSASTDSDGVTTYSVSHHMETANTGIYPTLGGTEGAYSVTVHRYCTVCGFTEEYVTVPAQKHAAVAATCTAPGNIEYYYAMIGYEEVLFVPAENPAHENELTAVDAQAVVIPAAEHHWNMNEQDAVWSWTPAGGDDPGTNNISAVMTVRCTACDATTPVNAVVEYQTSEIPTCVAEGHTHYIATAEFNGKTFSDTKAYTLPATGQHVYGAPAWTWAQDNASAAAVFTCSTAGCGHTETMNATMSSELVDGVFCHVATVQMNGNTYTDRKTAKSVTGHSLSLKGDIGVNFYLDLSDDMLAQGVTVDFAWNGKTARVTFDSNSQKDPVRGCYIASCNVTAAEMTDDITATVTIGDYTEVNHYSVRKYANIILTGNYSDELKTLVKTMLNYGAAAQTQFSHNNDDPENMANYSINYPLSTLSSNEISAIPGDIPAKATINALLTDTSLEYYGYSLLLKTETILRFYFRKNSADVIQLKWLDSKGKSVGALGASGENYVYIEIPNIPAPLLSETYTLQYGDTVLGTYSALSYVKDVLGDLDAEADLTNTVTALYRYNEAAVAYFNSIQ